MNKGIKKFTLLANLFVASIVFVACSDSKSIKNESPMEISALKQTDKQSDEYLQEDNAKALSIEEVNLDSANEDRTYKVAIDKIKNISDFDISDVWLIYNEIDKDGNTVSESKMFLDMTIKPGEIFKATFKLKEGSEGINMTSYEYNTSDNTVSINLKDNTVKITKNKLSRLDSSEYEVLSFSDAEKIDSTKDSYKYKIKIKNNSSQSISNITLKVVELNEDGDYIKVSYESVNSALKPSEESEIIVNASKKAKKIKVSGYIYDDINENSNIDIDLNNEQAEINNY